MILRDQAIGLAVRAAAFQSRFARAAAKADDLLAAGVEQAWPATRRWSPGDGLVENRQSAPAGGGEAELAGVSCRFSAECDRAAAWRIGHFQVPGAKPRP